MIEDSLEWCYGFSELFNNEIVHITENEIDEIKYHKYPFFVQLDNGDTLFIKHCPFCGKDLSIKANVTSDSIPIFEEEL